MQKTADFDLGNVVSGAFIYDSSIKSKMLESGVMLLEISETIARQKQEADGELRYQICALIFLIGRLPHEGPADAGIRANADTLADPDPVPGLITKLTTALREAINQSHAACTASHEQGLTAPDTIDG